jgi:hypothetical protein
MSTRDNSQDRPNPVTPTTTAPVTTGTPNVNVRPALAPTVLQPTPAQGRDTKAGQVDASNPSSTAESKMTPGSPPRNPPQGGGNSLRNAVQEIAASVECLLGDASHRDELGARRHLTEATRILSIPVGERFQDRASDLRTSNPALVSRENDKPGDIQQDLQRAMR